MKLPADFFFYNIILLVILLYTHPKYAIIKTNKQPMAKILICDDEQGMSSLGGNDRDDRVKDIMNFCFGKVSCDREDQIWIYWLFGIQQYHLQAERLILMLDVSYYPTSR